MAQKLMANAMNGRRHKSTVRPIQGGLLNGIVNQQYDSAGSLHAMPQQSSILNRNNSKPQL
jgi:hypothetical protein